MYTGGYFAGSDNTKFYIQDETGGVQVFADDGNGIIDVEVGDVVRATGEIVIFRDSIELIPLNNTADVEIMGTAEPPAPQVITASE